MTIFVSEWSAQSCYQLVALTIACDQADFTIFQFHTHCAKRVILFISVGDESPTIPLLIYKAKRVLRNIQRNIFSPKENIIL